MFRLLFVFVLSLAFSSQATAGNWNTGGQTHVIPQTDPGGPAVNYSRWEMPEGKTPNDATISLYEEKRLQFFSSFSRRGSFYKIEPAGNAVKFVSTPNPKSAILSRQLSKGYILSYLFYDDGILKYDGTPKSGRFKKDINDSTRFYTHSTGKSIISYLVGHAICDGYIGSIDEKINWPLMKNTLYHDQNLIDLLNMSAGDKHIVDRNSTYVMGSEKHHRDMDLITISTLLTGTKPEKKIMFYNNFLTDVIASYLAHRLGDNYNEFVNKIFQDKIKIENPVYFQLHEKTGDYQHELWGKLETRASYSFLVTRKDLLRIAVAMMKDYQEQTCVGKYLKKIQLQAKRWYKYAPNKSNSYLWIDRFARKYGAQFYFDFRGMDNRNILATEGRNGQNIMIDLDNSRIVVTQSAATAWDQRTFILNVIRDGKLPD